MKFENKREKFVEMTERVGLIVSLGAILLQIWVLISGIEAYLGGRDAFLFPGMLLSALALLACGVSVMLTHLDFLKGIRTGRSKTYTTKN